jgi:hypothetical protein
LCRLLDEPLTTTQGDRSEEFNTYGVGYTNEIVADTADADTVDKCARFSPSDVIWRYSECTAYLEVCAKVPKQADAFPSAAGRKYSDCKEKDISANTRSLISTSKHSSTKEVTEVEDKGAGKNTTQPERWFSTMAILKEKKRNRMDDALLNKLMFICLHALKSITALKTYLMMLD